jgi:HSP20 family protein
MEDNEEEWRKKMRKFLPGPWNFSDIDKMMEEMEKFFAQQFKDIEKVVPKGLVREKVLPDGTHQKEIGPIIYGYSITVGPDGKPVIREFGNVKKGRRLPGQISEEREPLVDIFVDENEAKIIAEIPGVQKEDINLTVSQNKLVISVDTESRKYYKEIDLPENILPEKAVSKYNNGILEIKIPLSKNNKSKAVRVKID